MCATLDEIIERNSLLLLKKNYSLGVVFYFEMVFLETYTIFTISLYICIFYIMLYMFYVNFGFFSDWIT